MADGATPERWRAGGKGHNREAAEAEARESVAHRGKVVRVEEARLVRAHPPTMTLTVAKLVNGVKRVFVRKVPDRYAPKWRWLEEWQFVFLIESRLAPAPSPAAETTEAVDG
jgi:hypothetical protein